MLVVQKLALDYLCTVMHNLHVRLIFDLGKENKIYHHSSKKHLKLVKLQSFVGKCYKIRKIRPREVHEFFINLLVPLSSNFIEVNNFGKFKMLFRTVMTDFALFAQMKH